MCSPSTKYHNNDLLILGNQALTARDLGYTTLTIYQEGGFNHYFYPLDMIAIPDFAAGAMENWGLITYRETALLFKPNASSEGNKERVAAVIAHELAHQV